MIDASIVVSYVNSQDTLPILLDHFNQLDYPKDRFETILINGDDYKPRISEAKGQMLAVEKARGRIIFFTNSDRYPPINWLKVHMSYYPEWDLVAGNVIHHVTRTLQAMNFGNISMKREVLDYLPILDIPSQQDADFAFRFVQQNRFKGKVIQHNIYEPKDQRWTWKHQYLMAQNIMVLRKKYFLAPSVSDVKILRHPAAIIGSLAGLLFAHKIVNAHDKI